MTFPPGVGDAATISVQEPVPQLLRDLVHERTGIYFELERVERETQLGGEGRESIIRGHSVSE